MNTYKIITSKVLVFILSALVFPTLVISVNAPRTAITYNKTGAVAWDGTMNDDHHIMEITDFNGDGKYDLRLGNFRYNNTGSNLNWTLPHFGNGTNLNLPQNGRGFRIDYDSDGDKDFIYKDEVRYYENTGSDSSPTWVDRGRIQAGGANITNDFSGLISWNNYGVPSIAMADWDADGKNDLVISVCDRGVNYVANQLQKNVYNTGKVFFYKNTGSNSSPSFTSGQKLQVSGNDLNLPFRGYINVVDYDNDSSLEIIAGGYDGKIRVIEKAGSPTVCNAPSVINTTYDLIQDLRTVDLDSDGDYDIVFLSASGLYIYKRNGATYSYNSRAYIANGNSHTLMADTFVQPCVVDWENDGDWDIVSGGENGYIYLFLNTNNNTTKQFNNPSRLLVNYSTYNQNSRTSGSYRWGLFEGAAGYTAPVVIDWDNDNDLDIITQDAESAKTYFIKNTGSRNNPSFTNAAAELTLNSGNFHNMWRTRPGIVDYDNDGDLDLIVQTSDRKLKVYSRNSGSDTDLNQIATVQKDSGGDLVIENNNNLVGMCPMQIVDLNNDGLFDILVSNNGTSQKKFQYYRNVGTSGSPSFASKEYLKNADGTDYVPNTDHEPHFWFVDWNDDNTLDLIDCHPRARFKGEEAFTFVDGTDLYNYDTSSTETIRDNTDTAYISKAGSWSTSTGISGYYGTNYEHDGNAGASSTYKNFMWQAALPTAGTYDVFLRWTADGNRASNTWVIIKHDGTRITTTVDQTQNSATWIKVADDKYFSTSTASGQNEVFVVNRHDDTTTWANGYVIADAVKFVKQ